MRPPLTFVMLLAVATLSARADFISLSAPSQKGTPGQTLLFNGELSNAGSETVYLNSANLNLAGNSFTVQFFDQFFNNVPWWLDPGQSTASIELFSIKVNAPFLDQTGTYAGTYTLVGGGDHDAQTVLASADFAVTVATAAAVPEPGGFAEVVVALLGVVGVHWRIRRRKTPPAPTN